MSPKRWKQLQEILAIGYFFLIPIQWTPSHRNIQAADLLFIPLALCVLCAPTRSRKISFHKLDLLVLLYLAGSAFSFLKSTDWSASGIAYAKQIYLAAVYGIFALLSQEPEDRNRWIRWYAGTVICFAAIGLAAVVVYLLFHVYFPSFGMPMPIPSLGTMFRVQATFHSHEYFGEYLAFGLPLLIGLCFKSAEPGIWLAGLVLLVTAAFFSVTHALVGLFAAALFSLWNRWNRGKLRIGRAILLMISAALFIWVNALSVVSVREWKISTGTNPNIPPAPYVYAFQDQQKGAEKITLELSYNPISYFLLKRFAWEAFLREPLTGVGIGRFYEVTHQAYQQGRIHARYERIDPHSTLFGRLAETGLLGTISLLLLWGGMVLYARRSIRTTSDSAWINGALLAGIGGLLINSLNVDVMNFRFLWVGFGIIRGSFRPYPNE